MLKDIKQIIIWKGQKSEWMRMNQGCSQGTINGPDIYNIYSFDIREKDPGNALMVKFVDDNSNVVTNKDKSKDQTVKEIEHVKE